MSSRFSQRESALTGRRRRVRRRNRFLVEPVQAPRTRRETVTWTVFAILAMLLLCWGLWDQRPQPLSTPRDAVAAQASS